LNNSYKVVWNSSRQAWGVAGELATSNGKSKSALSKKYVVPKRPLMSLILAASLSVLSSQAMAATWQGGIGDWTNAGKWDSGVPTSAEYVIIGATGLAKIGAGGNTSGGMLLNGGALEISSGGSLTSGQVNISTGSATVTGNGSSWNTGQLIVGGGGTGTLNILNGASVTSTNGSSLGGSQVTATSIANIDGAGSIWTITGATIGVGGNSIGTATLSNGGKLVASALTIDNRTGDAVVNIGAALGDAAVAPGTLTVNYVRLNENSAYSNTAELVFNHTDNAYEFAPNFTGAGTIRLIAGTTRFSGAPSVSNNPFTGEMSVQGGTLSIADGETLSLGGDYKQTASGVLKIGVSDDTTYGKLVVAGTATLPSNANIDVDVNAVNTLANGQVLTSVLSAGTLNSADSTFNVTDNSALFNFTGSLNVNAIDLTPVKALTVVDAVTGSGSSAGIGAATVFDDLTDNGSGTTAMDAVLTALGQLATEQEVANAVESTLPGVSGGVSQLTNIATNAVTGVVTARQDLTRGLSSGDDFMTGRHIWFKPFGGWTKQDERQGVNGYDIDSYGLALGFDGDISASWNVGAALAYINSDVESNLVSGSHSIDMDSYMAKVYATKMLDDVTALNLQVGAGTSNYDSTRRIFTGDIANADYDSWNMQLSAELERSYQVSDKTVMTPYVHADYSYVNVEDYNESGAGALNLNVGDDSADSLIIGAGVKANHSVSDSLLLMANAGIGYDVMTDRSSLTSSFVGGGANFTTEGIEPDELVYNAGVGTKYSLENGTEITASYNIDARQDYTDQSLSANFRFMY
jgi:autotransporter family porin